MPGDHLGYIAEYRSQRLVYGHVEFQGNSALASSYLEDHLYSRPGNRPDSFSLSEDLRRISRAYAQNGYPHARIYIAQIRLVNDSLIRVFTIQEGERVIVEKLGFEGHRVTKERILRKLVAIEMPWVFDSRHLEKAIDNLEKSGLFLSVGNPYLSHVRRDGANQKLLIFPVQEKSFNSIYGALGYIQDAGSSSRWLAGTIKLSLLNIAGTNRKYNVIWERTKKDRSWLEMGFYEPWIMGYPISGEIGLAHRIEDSTYVQSRADVIFSYNFRDMVSAGFGFGLERVVPGSSQAVIGSIKYRSLWRLTLNGRISDQEIGPRASLSLDYGRKRYYQSQTQHNVARLAADITHYFRFGTAIHPYLGGHGRMVITDEMPVPRPEQYTLGGARSLRGYYEEQFRADQVVWGNFELRFIAGGTVSFYPFYDVGYYWDGSRGRRGIEHGYGLGFSLKSRLGRVEFSYGLGRGDEPGDGKVHLVLGSEF